MNNKQLITKPQTMSRITALGVISRHRLESGEKETKMETLNEKIVRLLKDKKEGYIGIRRNKEDSANAEGFKMGLLWAIDTVETITSGATFEEISLEVIKHLNNTELYHPHHKIIVTSTNSELLEGIQSTGNVVKYLKD